MSTGATNEQIEAAAKSYFELDSPLFSPRNTWESVREPYRERRRENVARIANHLVPPDHRIVGPRTIAAIAWARAVASDVAESAGGEWEAECLQEALHYYPTESGSYDDHLARLSALIGDA